MKITAETITPAKAEEMLRANKNNRRLSKRAVATYAEQMRQGKWKLNGESVKFDESGMLVDGQHRLAAVIEADMPIKMSVVRDLTKDTIRTLDIGRKRTNACHLKIHGISDNADLAVVAAAIRIIALFKSGKYLDNKKLPVSPSDAIEFCEANPGILHAEERVPRAIGKMIPRSTAVAMYYLFSKIDRVKTDLFFVALAEGTNLPSGNPALTLRNRMFLMIGEKSSHTNKRATIYFMCRAFDAYLNGEDIHQLRFVPGTDIALPRLNLPSKAKVKQDQSLEEVVATASKKMVKKNA